MRYISVLIAFLLVTVILFACEKESQKDTNCFTDASTVRQIMNASAVIKETNGNFYIIEEGAIDTKLNPCTLPQAFQINNLPVTVSGDVKSTSQSGVCCTENFVITHISR